MYSDFFATMSFWEIILLLLGAVILGFLIRYFSGPKAITEKNVTTTLAPATPPVNEWEMKYKSFQSNYEQNKTEWLQKHKSSEDRAKTFQNQLVEQKAQYEKLTTEKAESLSKLRAMEAQRNEALETAKKITAELLGAGENIKAQQEKITSLSSALAMASNIKREAPKPIVISDEELTKKYETDTAALKKQLEEKDKRLISLLSKEAAANELQQRNDKLASENKILRTEMADANMDVEAAIQKAQQLKDLQLQVLSLSNKVALANGEATTVKKQLADQQKRHHQQAGKLNELRTSIGQERNAMKDKISELEKELSVFKPTPETVPVPEAEQITAAVEPVAETEKTAPLVEQTVVDSPKINITPLVIDIPAPLLQEVLPETTGLFNAGENTTAEKSTDETETSLPTVEKATNVFPIDEKAEIIAADEPAVFPVDVQHITGTGPTTETPVGKQNDLLLVQGIDTNVKELLESAGIDNWNKLAKTSAPVLINILQEKGGEAFASINPKSWPIQAQLLADGKWDAFSSYTKYLIGGVDPEEVKA